MAVIICSGEQGGGKTYCLVSEVVEKTVRKGKRTVVCNLPLAVDKWREKYYVIDCNDEHDLAIVESLPTITRKMKAGREIVETSAVQWGDNKPDILILSPEQITKFFEVSPSGSVIVLDELYQHMGTQSVDRQDKAVLTSYIFQHRHYKDDVYLVSHDPKNIDATIRRAITEQWWFYNSLKRCIWTRGIGGTLFAGLTWPKQFFIRERYMRNSQRPETVDHIHPEQRVFDLYNSFAQADLLAKEESSDDTESSDTKFDWFGWVGRWLECSWFAWVAAATLVGGIGWFVVNGRQKITELTGSKTKKKTVVASADGSASAVQVPKETEPTRVTSNETETTTETETGEGGSVEEQKPPAVVWASSRRLAMSDGSRWTVGDSRGRARLDAIDPRSRKATFVEVDTGKRWVVGF